MSEKRYVNLFDAHWGTERVSGHTKNLHDPACLDAVLAFMSDFKPHHLNLGGDMLDCGSISHWQKGKARSTEGMRLLNDAEGLRNDFLKPARETVVRDDHSLVYIRGNHESWIEDWVDENPTLEGIVDLDRLLGLTPTGWKIILQGGHVKMGKMYIIHGDQFKPNMNIAKKVVETYQRNVHFGHFHTSQSYTTIAPLDDEPKQGVAVPCLCRRNPGYANSSPNRWMQGFEYGYLLPDGSFFNSTALRINNKFVINGKVYR